VLSCRHHGGDRFWLAKLKTRPPGFSFGPKCTVQSSIPRGSVGDGICVVVEVLAGCVVWGLAVPCAERKWTN
jgi:hypothetical protein